jgi:hypothetical protein
VQTSAQAQILAELAELRREVREIRDRLPEREASAAAKLAKLLAAMPDDLGEFTAASLAERAALSVEDDLCAALMAIIGPKGSVDRLGRFLRKNAGISVAGKQLKHLYRSRAGELYRVLEVVDSNILPLRGGAAKVERERKQR